MRRERQLLRAPRRPALVATPRADAVRAAGASPAVLQRLHQVAGNRGVARLLQRFPTVDSPLVPKSDVIPVLSRIRLLLDIRLWGPADPRAPERVRELREAMGDIPAHDGMVLLKVLKGTIDKAPPAMHELRTRFECLHPISKGRIIGALEARLGAYEKEQEADRPERERFEKELPDAVKTFEHVFFGRAPNPRTDKKTGTVVKKYDERHWEEDKDPEFEISLKLKAGVKPSTALAAMAAEPKKWSFDCGEWVQVAENYAWFKALGADEFDKRMAPVEEGFRLRPQWSGVSQTEVKFQRSDPSAKFMRVTGASSMEEDERKGEELLAEAPVGSRITWSSTITGLKDWQHENTVKIGEDQYAAHGFRGKNVFSAAELESHYGKKIEKIKKIDGDTAYQSVFLEVIELYKTPGKAK